MQWTTYVWPFELVNWRMFMTRSWRTSLVLATVAALFGVAGAPAAKAQQKKPNILILWGDDIGYWNLSAYKDRKSVV